MTIFWNEKVAARGWKEDSLIAFFHTQRTAGSSLRHRFAAAMGKDKVYCTQFVDNYQHWQNLTAEDLSSFSVYAGHAPFQEKDMGRDVFPISMIRHPLHRTFSLYFYCLKYPNQFLHSYALDHSIEEFYDAASAAKPAYFHDLCCRRICGKPDFDLARETIESKFLAVGRTEEFESFLSRVLQFMGFESTSESHPREITGKYRELESKSELSRRILDNNSNDLELYNYMEKSYFGT